MTMLAMTFLSVSHDQSSSLSLPPIPNQTDKKAMKVNYLQSQRFKVRRNFIY